MRSARLAALFASGLLIFGTVIAQDLNVVATVNGAGITRERLQSRVHCRDVSLVGITAKALGEGLGWRIGEVRLEEVNPRQRGTLVIGV